MTELPISSKSRRWHDDRCQLERFLVDLIVEETTRLRQGEAALPPRPWAGDLPLDERGLGLDSLELLTVASIVNEALHLYESGTESGLIAPARFGDWLDIAQASLNRYDAHLTFRTSGSSGAPKSCGHARMDLEQEVAHLANLLIGRRRILSAVPSHHIYGFLFTVLLPAQLHTISVLDVRHLAPQALEQTLCSGDLIISHPAHWALLAQYMTAIPENVVGVSSTAPCSDSLACALQERGLTRLLQVYGSSETSGLGWRDAHTAPYRLMPFWTRESADETTLIRHASDGSQRRVDVPDHLVWNDAVHFIVSGRRDEAVQVAGTNVYPERVARSLMEHPDVAHAGVRLMRPHEGNRLKAYIVAVDGTDVPALRLALTHWVNQHLSAAERPKSFTIGSTIPINTRGKLADWPLQAESEPILDPQDDA